MARQNPKETAAEAAPARLIVGMSGASGAILGIRMLQALRPLPVEVHLVISRSAELTIAYETDMKVPEVRSLADATHGINELAAPISSGSFPTLGMVIAPCSIKTMSEIATGVTSSLLTRAADVTLKERRPLVLMVRETPLHVGHLRSLAQLAEMGAIILPPLPAFYSEPRKLEDFVDQITGRALDLLGYDWPGQKRWGEDGATGRRKRRAKD